MNITEKLILIQSELKAPKGQFNSFGKYNYRSAEDILESVKPLLKKHDCALVLSDSIEFIGTRYYVKATAKLIYGEETTSTSAYARECNEKKGQDDSQITGTASSYARKYALNGLFCIDDTKDADTDEFANQDKAMAEKKAEVNKKAEAKRMKAISEVADTLSDNGIEEATIISLYKVKSLKELTIEKCDNILKHIEDIKKKQEESK